MYTNWGLIQEFAELAENGESTATLFERSLTVEEETTRALIQESIALWDIGLPSDEKNCGTGSGGFKPGNTCSRGGLQSITKHADGSITLANGDPLPAHIPKFAPAWTNVKVDADAHADLVVQGLDTKGRVQSIYSDAHWAKAAEAKFSRITELHRKERYVSAQIKEHLKSTNEDTREAAHALRLIHHTGLRPGGEGDTGAAIQAYGATTLEGRHIKKTPEGVTLEFVGKKGVSLQIPVTDHEIAKDLLARKSKAGNTGKIFNTDDARLRDFVHTLDGGGFKTKDFRTLVGTKTALDVISKYPKPSTMKEYKRAVKEVAEIVSAKLGNTPTVALQSYIDPTVFAKWRL